MLCKTKDERATVTAALHTSAKDALTIKHFFPLRVEKFRSDGSAIKSPEIKTSIEDLKTEIITLFH